MKTAMQELIEQLQYHFANESRGDFFDASKYLEKEKEQIKKDYHNGQISIVNIFKDKLKIIGVYDALTTDLEDAEDYYNETYNQNK